MSEQSKTQSKIQGKICKFPDELDVAIIKPDKGIQCVGLHIEGDLYGMAPEVAIEVAELLIKTGKELQQRRLC